MKSFRISINIVLGFIFLVVGVALYKTDNEFILLGLGAIMAGLGLGVLSNGLYKFTQIGREQYKDDLGKLLSGLELNKKQTTLGNNSNLLATAEEDLITQNLTIQDFQHRYVAPSPTAIYLRYDKLPINAKKRLIARQERESERLKYKTDGGSSVSWQIPNNTEQTGFEQLKYKTRNYFEDIFYFILSMGFTWVAFRSLVFVKKKEVADTDLTSLIMGLVLLILIWGIIGSIVSHTGKILYLWHKYKLKPNIYITPLYVIKTAFNEVKFWTILSIKDVKVSENYVNGIYQDTTIKLVFEDSEESIKLKHAEDKVKQFLYYLNTWQASYKQACLSRDINYFHLRDDFWEVDDTLRQIKSEIFHLRDNFWELDNILRQIKSKERSFFKEHLDYCLGGILGSLLAVTMYMIYNYH